MASPTKPKDEPELEDGEQNKDEDVFCTKCEKLCASLFADGEEVHHEDVTIVSYPKGADMVPMCLCADCTTNFYQFLYKQLSNDSQARLVAEFLKPEEEDEGEQG